MEVKGIRNLGRRFANLELWSCPMIKPKIPHPFKSHAHITRQDSRFSILVALATITMPESRLGFFTCSAF